MNHFSDYPTLLQNNFFSKERLYKLTKNCQLKRSNKLIKSYQIKTSRTAKENTTKFT